jgi:predicted nuclease of predicted toxin-antitoxin system
MKRILLDENVPVSLSKYLKDHDVRTINQLKLKASNDATVLRTASADFDVLITADKTLRFEQNLAVQSVSLIILPTNRLAGILERIDDINAALFSKKKLTIL